LPDRAQDLALSGRIEAEGRLVEKDDVGIVHERPGDPEPCRIPRL
jgi:hypothetical protein